MRWTVDGVQAMFDLRSAYINGQWKEFQTYRIDQESRRLCPQQQLLKQVEWPIAT
jgi:hypothetical protein